MREIPYTEKKVPTEEGKVLSLAYFVMADESLRPIRYGVKIAEANNGDEAQALDLTTSIKTIYELVEKLAQESVTPTGLPDVMADWL